MSEIKLTDDGYFDPEASRIIRVFPRRTNATPVDPYVYVGDPRLFIPPREKIKEVHVSVTFSWDRREGERLARAWSAFYDEVKIGGAAFMEKGGEFTPGMYLKRGFVITSRGCPNKCWFCRVGKIYKGEIRELEVTDGFNVVDDNLLATSDEHIRAVFEMLERNHKGKALFTGGLEAARLKSWHVELLKKIKTKRAYFAYDTPDDYEPLVKAGELLRQYGFNFSTRVPSAYVLIGYPKDTFEKAEERLWQTIDAGFMPYAMLWRGLDGKFNNAWRKFQYDWSNPMYIATTIDKTRKTGSGKKYTEAKLL